jgi:2-keto-4-pentenoate hydratase
MISPSGAEVPAAYGSGPTWESDLLLVVKDDGINTAKDKAEVYKHLRGFRPFIELPNRNYAADVNVTADQVEALNVGARYGVMSAEQPLPQTPEAMAALVNFSVETVITGTEPRTETGRAIDTLGDVLEIALFARDHALAEGHKLKAGDLISIGVVTPARAPVAEQDLEIRYHILPTTSSVSVRFR